MVTVVSFVIEAVVVEAAGVASNKAFVTVVSCIVGKTFGSLRTTAGTLVTLTAVAGRGAPNC